MRALPQTRCRAPGFACFSCHCRFQEKAWRKLVNSGPNLKSRLLRRNKITMIKKLLHTRYRVSDLERTVSFYRDVLGLEEVRRQTSGRGSQLVFLKAPGSEEEIEICKFDKSGPIVVGPDLTHLAFEVDNLEEFRSEER